MLLPGFEPGIPQCVCQFHHRSKLLSFPLFWFLILAHCASPHPLPFGVDSLTFPVAEILPGVIATTGNDLSWHCGSPYNLAVQKLLNPITVFIYKGCVLVSVPRGCGVVCSNPRSPYALVLLPSTL